MKKELHAISFSRFTVPLVLSAISVWLWTSSAVAATIVVPDNYSTIQQAIDAASNGDTILVKPGTYFEHLSIAYKSSITLKSTEGPEQTIIDGDGSGRPLYGNKINYTVIDGFTFTNGRGEWGGGVHIGSSWGVTITNSIITGNTADYNGGGIYAGSWGGASLKNCTISNNTAGQYGGGMFGAYGGVSATNSIIIGNTAGYAGGAGAARYYCGSVSVYESQIIGNNAGKLGGAFYTGDVSGCVSGLYARNSVIVNNSAPAGGAVYVDNNRSAAVVNSTVVRNSAEDGSAVFQTADTGRMISANNIVYYNSASRALSGSGISAQYSDIEGGYPGAGNIDADPQFVDTANNDFHLKQNSPCIDAVPLWSPYAVSIDIEGKPRPSGAASDMGAFEFISNQPPVAAAGPDQTIETTSCAGAAVILDGSASSDPDNDPLTYIWTENGSVISTDVNPTVTLSYGSHNITLTVDDGKGGTATDDVKINVVDTTAPALNVSLNPNVLWPPNHKMVTIMPAVTFSDACNDTTTMALISKTSNEPDNGLGDGDTENDIVINADGTISLRAERSGKGSGRVYTITYQATDVAGNSTTASATVTVPHNK